MPIIQSLILEAIICAIIYGVTRNVYLINLALCGFAVFHLIEEYRAQRTLTSLKSMLSWAVMGLSIATMYFHTLLFMKWKGFFMLLTTACMTLCSPYLWSQSIGQALLKNVVELDNTEAQAINNVFGLFLLWMSILNAVIVIYRSDAEWAWFKTILLPAACLAFGVMVILIYIDRSKPKEEA